MRLTGIGMSLGGKVRFGQDLKQRCLAYLGQAGNSSFHKNSWVFAPGLASAALIEDGITASLSELKRTIQHKS
jgi:hypothetical protein